jgi:hypothetical protein
MTLRKNGLVDISNVSKSGTSLFINSNLERPRHTVSRKDDKKEELRKKMPEDHFNDLTVIQQHSGRILENNWQPHPSTSYSLFTETDHINPDLITLRLVLQHGDCEQETDIKIHRSREVVDVLNKAGEWLKDEDVLPSSVQFDNFRLMYGG